VPRMLESELAKKPSSRNRPCRFLHDRVMHVVLCALPPRSGERISAKKDFAMLCQRDPLWLGN
jgi:hypothetical protein